MGLAAADTWAESSALCPWRALQEDVGVGGLCEFVSSFCVRPHDGKKEPCNMSYPSERGKLQSFYLLGFAWVRFRGGLNDFRII